MHANRISAFAFFRGRVVLHPLHRNGAGLDFKCEAKQCKRVVPVHLLFSERESSGTGRRHASQIGVLESFWCGCINAPLTSEQGTSKAANLQLRWVRWSAPRCVRSASARKRIPARFKPCGSARLATARRGTCCTRMRAQVQRTSVRYSSPTGA